MQYVCDTQLGRAFLKNLIHNYIINMSGAKIKNRKIRFWRMRPDDIVFRPSTKTKAGVVCILEFKLMSDVTDQYLLRARSRAENQYESLRRALGVTLQHQRWQVEHNRLAS